MALEDLGMEVEAKRAGQSDHIKQAMALDDLGMEVGAKRDRAKRPPQAKELFQYCHDCYLPVLSKGDPRPPPLSSLSPFLSLMTSGLSASVTVPTAPAPVAPAQQQLHVSQLQVSVRQQAWS